MPGHDDLNVGIRTACHLDDRPRHLYLGLPRCTDGFEPFGLDHIDICLQFRECIGEHRREGLQARRVPAAGIDIRPAACALHHVGAGAVETLTRCLIVRAE